MQGWTYPLHLIDFETAAVALPFHAGRRPYEQVAFQFSHHVLEADGRLRHANQFLNAAPGEFPNYAFVRSLREALRHDQGTIMRWSNHENTILTAIKQQLQQDEARPDQRRPARHGGPGRHRAQTLFPSGNPGQQLHQKGIASGDAKLSLSASHLQSARLRGVRWYREHEFQEHDLVAASPRRQRAGPVQAADE
jgi:hypothetical protein